ncbi:hypothetical protein [Streptomyces sp. NPDC002602]|uniref:hypothetical protein n=1 Tax=Streptomyces sp. NPDC002602 TaxID=3364654 RepID=UPI003696B7D3
MARSAYSAITRREPDSPQSEYRRRRMTPPANWGVGVDGARREAYANDQVQAASLGGGDAAFEPPGWGRAAVACRRRRHPDFPDPAAGTDVRLRFDRRVVVAWLLAHNKIEVPTGPTIATLVLAGAGAGAGAGGATHRFRSGSGACA